MSISRSVSLLGAVVLAVAAGTGCAVHGYARDVGTGTSDSYSGTKDGMGHANRADSFALLRPGTFSTVGRTALPDVLMKVEARTGASMAPVVGSVAEAEARANHDTSFTITKSRRYALRVGIVREYASVQPGEAEARFLWSIVVRNVATGAEVMRLDSPGGNSISVGVADPAQTIDGPQGWREVTGDLDEGVTYGLTVSGMTYVKTVKQCIPGEGEAEVTAYYTWPFAHATVDLYAYLDASR